MMSDRNINFIWNLAFDKKFASGGGGKIICYSKSLCETTIYVSKKFHY